MNNVCQVCKKARATVHLTEIDPENNAPTEMHLCEECAAKAGGKGSGSPGPAVAGIGAGAPRAAAGRNVVCTSCGMTYQEFRLKGRLGCPSCYDAFLPGLVRLLERIHGASIHVGPTPPGRETVPEGAEEPPLRTELSRLKRRLKSAVREEDYEEAARLRDRIREVEEQLGKKGTKKSDG